jgi:hypothetical protein
MFVDDGSFFEKVGAHLRGRYAVDVPVPCEDVHGTPPIGSGGHSSRLMVRPNIPIPTVKVTMLPLNR